MMSTEATPILYYDASCGPCSWFARLVEWASRRRLRRSPLTSDRAEIDLAGLSESDRFGYAHLVRGARLESGSTILPGLVDLTFGSAAGRVVRAVPPIDLGMRWLYDRFWEHRRTKGCAAPNLAMIH